MYAWIALSDATTESGCMRMLPGSHLADSNRMKRARQRATFYPMVKRSPWISMRAKRSTSSFPPALPAFITHISSTVRGPTTHTTAGSVLVSAIFQPVCGSSGKARPRGLGCGKDSFGHFDPEMRPKTDLDDAARQFHAEACDRFASHGSKRTEVQAAAG